MEEKFASLSPDQIKRFAEGQETGAGGTLSLNKREKDTLGAFILAILEVAPNFDLTRVTQKMRGLVKGGGGRKELAKVLTDLGLGELAGEVGGERDYSSPSKLPEGAQPGSGSAGMGGFGAAGYR